MVYIVFRKKSKLFTMAYEAQYDLVLPSFSDLIFTSLLYHGSHYYGLHNSHFLPFLATEF